MYRLIYERIGDFGCGLLDKSYTGHANETAFNEGRRLVGRELHVLLQMVTPHEYTAMMAEMLQEDLERRGVEDDG